MEYTYDRFGAVYASLRRTDSRVAAQIHACLGNAATLLNVGAGTGSYEPQDRTVIAVEPSRVMRSQRSSTTAPAIIANADSLPFDDNSFDASMTILSLHHWPDPAAGLREMRRVTRNTVVVLTYDPAVVDSFWLFDYVPELTIVDRKRYPSIPFITDTLGGEIRILTVRVPIDCIDGFNEAFYARPEVFFDPKVRASQSAWAFLPSGAEERSMKKLELDLKNGLWEERYGHLRNQQEYLGAIRLVCSSRTA